MQNDSSPSRALPSRSPLSPLPRFVPATVQSKKRPMGKEVLDTPKTLEQRGAGAREQRGGAHEARDENLHRNKGDERDERDEDERRHVTPHGSPRILAKASPEQGAGASKVARKSNLDHFGFGHEGPTSSFELSPRRPSRVVTAKALLRTRARAMQLELDRPSHPPPLERRPRIEDSFVPMDLTQTGTPSQSDSMKDVTPPTSETNTPRSGSPNVSPSDSDDDSDDDAPRVVPSSSNVNGSRLLVHYNALALLPLSKLNSQHIFGASQRADLEVQGAQRNPLAHICAHGVHADDRVSYFHTWVKGKDLDGIGREFCSLQTYRREVRGLLFGGHYTEYI
ncbi:hypothetical protein T492DRAFT_981499 [Pavlovales sp. CCMP2436]|nr:hypothetical protein T492DRAFT_981499 [Pavlovales sp. CCMP2436]